MNILFVHQSFPGQYRHILSALASQGCHQIIGLGLFPPSESLPPGVKYFRYGLTRGNHPGIDEFLVDLDSKVIRGQGCSQLALQLRKQGFIPDIICAHPGWGEALFLLDVWPNTPLLCYQEFFYNSIGFDYDFDSELQGSPDWEASARLRMKNANPLLMLHSSSWNVTPTKFQKSTFPSAFHSCISVIHDGIDTTLASPDFSLDQFSLPDGHIIQSSDTIITFVNRHLEPYRGCHTFIRSIPSILDSNPSAHIVIVGQTDGVSYGKPGPNNKWCDVFFAEIDGSYDKSRVHLTGSLGYSDFIQLLKLSSCHVYLSYPFVLSWSLLEAMSIGLPIVGSSTPSVKEVISDGVTGLLVDFFSPNQVSSAVTKILSDKASASSLGKHARQLVHDYYSLEKCVPQQLALIQLVASHAFD